MREIKDPRQMYLYSLKAKSHHKQVSFVPTMGALHQGHLSLVAEAKKRGGLVVVSIFVNPAQFAPNEDFKHYPRNLRKDKKLLEALGVDVLFLPGESSMYPGGHKTFVEVEQLSKKLCGRSRPIHFRGVTTVLVKLFNIVYPDLVFMGEKDFQQAVIARQMVRDLNFPLEVVSLPTIREDDGLALSSRNSYLNRKERESAAILYKALVWAKEAIEMGERDPKKIVFKVRSMIGAEPTVRLDYVAVADPETLDEVEKIKGKTLIALAAYLGQARLIDNIVVSAG